MSRFLFLLLLLPFAQDDDYELASALANRGWFDLARHLYGEIEKNGSLPAERRAEGKLGILRLRIREARTESDAKKKKDAFDAIIAELQSFIDSNKNHPRRAEALSELGELRQEKGRWLLSQSKTNPDAAKEAEKEFDAAEKLFQDQIDELAKNPVPPPADEKDRAAAEKYAQWEQKMMFAKYNKGVAMFAHAEAYRENPDAHHKKCSDSDRAKADHPRSHCAMRRTLTEMIQFFNNDFMWQYEQYLLAYDAFIYMGRACQLLAEYSDRAEAEKWWTQCFNSVGKAKSLLTDKEAKKYENARELAVHSYYWEIKARIAYGDTKKGAAATREYLKAAELANDLFRLHAPAKKEDMGKAILLEQAKALCKAGELKKGIELLMRLKTENKGTQIEDFAVDILGEYAGDGNLQFAIDAADNFFSRGEAFFYKAIQKYRNALNAMKSEDERTKYLAYCWHQIALCYYHLDRFHEAAAACTVVVYPASPWLNDEFGRKCGVLKLGALDRIVKRTKDPADQKAMSEYNQWATSQPQIRDHLGKGPIVTQANEYEAKKQYLEAIKLWEQLTSDSTYREIAIFSIGYDYYYAGLAVLAEIRGAKNLSEAEKTRKTKQAMEYWDQSLKRFLEHVALVEKSARDREIMKRAIGSIFHACKIYVHPEKNQPEKALQISQGLETKYPGADSKFVLAILGTRLEAKLGLDSKGFAFCAECPGAVKAEGGACPKCRKAARSYVDEAEEDMLAIRTRYEKDPVGRDYYLRALLVMAQRLESKAYDLRGENATLAKEYMIKAAEYWFQFYTNNTEPFRGEQLEAIAEKLFFGAEERLDRAEKEEDPAKREKALAQAKDMFGKARTLFEQFLAEFGSTLDAARAKGIKRMVARAAVKSGDFQKAIDILNEIIGTGKVEETSDGSVWEDKADCLFAQARSMSLGEKQLELTKEADRIYATLASALIARNVITDHTYRLLAKHTAALWFYDPQKLDKFLSAMDKRGYGRRYACPQCRRTISPTDLKGGTCIYDRCALCGESYKAGSAKECANCKGEVKACGNTALLQFGWDDRIRHECAILYLCRHWRCGNIVRDYAFRCRNSSCGYAATFAGPEPAERDCPKCSTRGSLGLAAFKKYLCTKCRCTVELETAGGPGRDCETHYRCGKCGRGYLKNTPATCSWPGCGGTLAEHSCGAKGSLVPACTRCDALAAIRRADCAKCGESFLLSALKDKSKCPKDGGALAETFEPLVRSGCGTKYAASYSEDLRRLKCLSCEKAYGATKELEATGTCPSTACTTPGKGRLRDVVECEKCRKLGTVEQVRAWTAANWQGGKQCDEIESWRELVIKKVPDQGDRVKAPEGAKHVHGQSLKSEEQLTGGRK